MTTQSSSTFGIGDVFVAVGDGKVQWRLADGTLNATLDTGLAGYTSRMAFDKATGDLYVTNFSAGAVTRFDTAGNRIGTFGTGYNCHRAERPLERVEPAPEGRRPGRGRGAGQ